MEVSSLLITRMYSSLSFFFLLCLPFVSAVEVKVAYKPSRHYCYGSHHDTNTNDCTSVHAKFSDVSFYSDILDFLVKEDSNSSIRHIAIKAHNTNSATINEALDLFISPRPWWIIKEESFPWQDEKLANLSLINVSHASLIRFSSALEGYLRRTAKIQFPPEKVCNITLLNVGRLIDNGWASMMALYGYARGNANYAIFAPYISKTNSPEEDTIFAHHSFCPTEKNKWNCAFLPTTNCTFPLAITECKSRECLPETGTTDVYFDVAAAFGKKIDAKKDSSPYHPALNSPSNEYQKSVMQDFQKYRHHRIIPSPHFDALNSSHVIAPEADWVLFLYGFLWRHGRYRVILALNQPFVPLYIRCTNNLLALPHTSAAKFLSLSLTNYTSTEISDLALLGI